MEGDSSNFPTWKLLGSGLVGAVTFPAVLATSQVAVFKPLRLSFRPGLACSLCGLASVSVASLGASWAALKTISVLQEKLPKSERKLLITYRHLFLSTVSGVAMFRVLGGRFERVLPSNLMRPGVFGADWIPAKMEVKYANSSQREMVQALGRKHGCHSCGTKNVEKYIADHQPPSRLIGNTQGTLSEPNTLMQRFYPQCKRCSQVQGGLLAGDGADTAVLKSGAIRTHGRSLRLYHTFLPVPFLVTYLLNTERESISPAATKAETLASESTVRSLDKEQEKFKAAAAPEERKEPNAPAWLDLEVPISNFPLLIVWQEVVKFLDSFMNPLCAFHLTLWAFTIVAALGTV